MKGTPKIFISAGSGLLVLTVAFLLVLFYLEATNPAKKKSNTFEVEIAVGDETVPAYLGPIENLMDSMQLDKVNVQVPAKLKTNEIAQVRVSLRLAGSIEMLKLSLANEALKVGATVKVSDKMAVLLSGDSYKITPRGPAEQSVSKGQNTEWKWEIKPKLAGPQELSFTVVAFYTVDGKRYSHAIRNFDKTIKVAAKN